VFDNIGPAELLTLALVGMFVLGPERLPEAARWVARTVQTIKDFATGTRDQLRNELGPDFDEFRKPLEDLRSVRDLDPRRAVRQGLFADPPADGSWSGAGTPASPDPAIAGGAALGSARTTNGVAAGGAGAPHKGQSDRAEPLKPGEVAPVDDDAT
jgi:sec-independent protein translocase protein TatB